VASLVYLAHSYRSRDAMVNDYFARLIESEDLVPSLDPPSQSVNAAKLERHLGQSDAMIAILTERETGASPHILYEIALGIKSHKPLLVFVEDTLPPAIIPTRVLQRRFSYRSFLRNTREYKQSLAILRDYIGDPPPSYQSLLTPRTCLVLGGSTLPGSSLEKIRDYIGRERRYETLASADLIAKLDEHPMAYDALRDIDLVIAFCSGTLDRRDGYLLGIAQGISKPSIILTAEPAFPSSGDVPEEYQPRILTPGAGVDELIKIISEELELYEEDFLDLQDTSSTDRYMQFLIDLGGRGRYGTRTRAQSIEIVMGDRYDIQGQAGAVGPNAHVHDVTFSQLWNQVSDKIDLPALADELERLRSALRAAAKTPDEDQIVADVGQAELAAKNGNGPDVMRYLRNAGKWAFGVATSIGAAVAAAVIKAAAGL
jgi:hypothetical protein